MLAAGPCSVFSGSIPTDGVVQHNLPLNTSHQCRAACIIFSLLQRIQARYSGPGRLYVGNKPRIYYSTLDDPEVFSRDTISSNPRINAVPKINRTTCLPSFLPPLEVPAVHSFQPPNQLSNYRSHGNPTHGRTIGCLFPRRFPSTVLLASARNTITVPAITTLSSHLILALTHTCLDLPNSDSCEMYLPVAANIK